MGEYAGKITIKEKEMIEKTRNFSLYLLIFALPFQGVQLFDSPYFNLTNIAFFIFFFVHLHSILDILKNRYVFSIVVPFIIIWVISLFNTVLNYYPGSLTAFSFVRQSLMYVYLFIGIVWHCNDNASKINKIIIYFISSVSLLSFFLLTGIGVREAERLAFASINTGHTMLHLFIAYAFCIYFILVKKNDKKYTYLLLFLSVVYFYLIVLGATRVIILVAVVFPVIFVIYLNIKISYKLYLLIAALIFSTGAWYYSLSNELVRERFERIEIENEEDRSFGNRLPIWRISFDYIGENLMFGGGASGWEYYTRITRRGEQGARPGIHNGYLQVLLYSGLVGFIAYLSILYYLFRYSFLINAVFKNPFYISFMIILLVYTFIQVSLNQFTIWVLFALIVSNYSWATKISQKNN